LLINALWIIQHVPKINVVWIIQHVVKMIVTRSQMFTNAPLSKHVQYTLDCFRGQHLMYVSGWGRAGIVSDRY